MLPVHHSNGISAHIEYTATHRKQLADGEIGVVPGLVDHAEHRVFAGPYEVVHRHSARSAYWPCSGWPVSVPLHYPPATDAV